MDGAGNLYVADFTSHTIRKVVTSTGVVTTLAGTAGMPGSTDGTGPAARFNYPVGVALDSVGNLYVSDYGNHTIRKVVTGTGAVTTLAGTAGMAGSTDGTGLAARFSNPERVALDSAGNLYVAEQSNHTIRKVVTSSGAVSTLAGTAGMAGSTDGTGPAARFYKPEGVALDGAGNLYVADAGNHTIRKVVPGTGVVTTLAGTAGMAGGLDGTGLAARFNYPVGVVADGAGNLYVADFSNHTIRKVVTGTGVVTTLAGTAGMLGSLNGTGPAARFYNPDGVALDGAGNLYVADDYNHTIRKVVTGTSAVTTLAGTAAMSGSTDGTGPAARFYNPDGVALDGAGNLYVADEYNHTIRKVVTGTGEVTTLAGTARMPGSLNGTGAAAQFNNPVQMALDSAGNLYVADAGNKTIRKVVTSTGAVTTLAGTAGMAGSTDGTGAAAQFNNPVGVALDGAGNLYVADYGSHTIRKVVTATAAVTTLAGMAGMPGSLDGTSSAARFNSPSGVAVDGIGNLYVADYGNHTIRKVVTATGEVTTLAGTAGMPGSVNGTGMAARFSGPARVTADGAGNLYVAEWGNSTLRRITLADVAVTTLAGVAGQGAVKLGPLPGGLSRPGSIAISPTGGLFIADANENAVLAIH